MNLTSLKRCAAPLFIAGYLTAFSPILVAQPSWADGNKQEKHTKKGNHEQKQDQGHEKKERSKIEKKKSKHFGDRERTVVFDYYNEAFSSGHCPPGLEKKHNGCMPPGLAKKQWAIGRPLPQDVAVYELPPAVVLQLGTPPVGHRYVRVAKDILMIAVGTGMVMDALEDLSR